ncbi:MULTISPECIES: hypothetical protein [Alteromonadaceae]|nr:MULTISPECIES: hypothetical protein [Aliiglaciecola]MDO6709261.1 hypothetical protein [Aliiglaciecola sp. 2_MG-2023]MDO6750409.1 hypothetical protein [Aliiglaciecola sp. 1_MG-2023]
MNRSSKGFGLTGVFATVLFLVVLAVVSTPASSQTTSTDIENTRN